MILYYNKFYETKKFQLFLTIALFCALFVSSCKGGKLPGADARQISPDPRERVAKILKKEGDLDYQILVKLKVELLISQVQMNFGEHL